jgi:predicted nuclease of predicted toxin-antitoxin system
VKLLFDANLSPALVKELDADFRESEHVRALGLQAAPDADIWERAKADAFTIVSKDTDFRELSFVKGHPPKVIWLDVGNAGTNQIVALIQREGHRITEFEQDGNASLLILSLAANAV